MAVPDKIGSRQDKLLERRVDVVEEDVSPEAIDAGVDAAGFRAEHEFTIAKQVRYSLQVRDTAGIRLIRFKAADTLIVIPLEVEFLRCVEAICRDVGMCF